MRTRKHARGARGRALVAGAAVVALAASAGANTLTQNVSWTIDKSGTDANHRVVAYGDSIFAGHYGSIWYVAKRAAPHVDGEYLAHAWDSDIQVVRRTKSGATADDIYHNKIIDERGYMQSSNTRVVMFEMCGNDYLQARDAFQSQSGTCDYSGIEDALAACTYYMEQGMRAINYYATNAKARVISNLYYPGYDADDTLSSCDDPNTGQPVNMQDVFIEFLAQSNWRACRLAEYYGFECVDSFAEYMGADYDSNGDGVVDSEALRYRSGESESAYVERISVTLRDTVRDANFHFVSPSTSYDYLVSDDIHPTFFGNEVIRSGLFWSTGSGSDSPDFSEAEITDGKNPEWNKWGHERMGWAHSVVSPDTP